MRGAWLALQGRAKYFSCMRDPGLNSAVRAYEAGKRALRLHRPDIALRFLREAVAECPASCPGELSERLYWLAVALLRLDRSELALKSLASAQKLRPRGIARRAYVRRVNDYGMPRRSRPELDDFYAFYSIHASRYLATRPGARFASMDEKDMATRLIAESWKTLSASGRLVGRSAGEKLALFRSWPVSFPPMLLSGAVHGGTDASVLRVNFRRGMIVDPDDRCPCGSGLAYRCCCGRLASPRGLSCE